MSSSQLAICDREGEGRYVGCSSLLIKPYFSGISIPTCFLMIVSNVEPTGVLYLYVKTIERAHSPANMWEKIKLSNNYSKALEQVRPSLYSSLPPSSPFTFAHSPQPKTSQVDKELIHWPNFTIHKCKQRITKITQYLIKMRRLKLRQDPKLIGIKKKLDRRETVRERKALAAAHLERSIEKELVERLKSKAYGDAPLNVNEAVWQAVLGREKEGEKGKGKVVDEEMDEDEMEDEESEEEDEEELEREMEEEWDENDEREFVSDISGDEDGLSDLEEVAVSLTFLLMKFHETPF